MEIQEKTPNYLWSVINNKCPRCRKGDIYVTKNPYALKNNKYILMHDRCEVCGQPTDIEVGFYYGTSFVSYGITVALSGVSFILWWIFFGFSLHDNRLFWWLGVNSVLLLALQPVFMRLSRSLWLSWFVKYDKNWKTNKLVEPERIVKSQMKNW